MNIDPRHLFLVRAIVDHGTFNRAAEALGMSQPALSKSIALLERRLGAKIFDRGARGSTLTEVGEVIARSAQNLDHLIARAQKEVVAKSQRVDGPLAIGATPSIMLGILPETIGRLSAPSMKLSLTLIEGLDDTLLPRLQRGEIDLLIGPVDGLHPSPPGVIETKLAEEQFCVGVGPDHRLAHRKLLSLRELADEAWILPTPGSGFYRTAEALFISSGMPLPSDQITTNSLTLHETLVATAGRIGFETAGQLYGRNSPIRLIPLAGSAMRAIGIRRMEGVRLPPIADKLVAVLAEVMGELTN